VQKTGEALLKHEPSLQHWKNRLKITQNCVIVVACVENFAALATQCFSLKSW